VEDRRAPMADIAPVAPPGSRRRRTLVALLAVALGAAGAVTVATGSGADSDGSAVLDAAMRTTRDDATGDVAWTSGDLTSASLEYTAGLVTVSATTSTFSSPGSGPWTSSTGVVWQLDTNGDGVMDRDVFYLAASGTPTLTVTVKGTMVPLCTGTATSDSVSRTFNGTFPSSCIGDPANVSWAAVMLFTQAGTTSVDRVPDSGTAGPTARTVPSSPSGSAPFGNLDVVSANIASVRVAGWAIDPDTTGPIAVHVYVDGVLRSMPTADRTRVDIGAAYPAFGAGHGFDVTLEAAGGTRSVCAYAINTGAGSGNRLLGCRDVTVRSGAPIGNLDVVTGGPGTVRIAGWAIDPDTSAPISVHLYVDGVQRVAPLADKPRPDVAASFPSHGAAHGFDVVLSAQGGQRSVCAWGIDSSGSGANTLLGCRDVAVPTGSPFGSFDVLTAAGGAITAQGWAIDPDTSAPVVVHAYIDGVLNTGIANQTREDVGARHPGYGSAHGFTITRAAATGVRQVCVYVINLDAGSNTFLGCRSVTV
jgi:hypothetical protein